MNKTKKGFTIVELVIVIAIIAILAAVLIPTFANVIKKANDSAYEQERTNQQIADIIEKVDNSNYLTWEDFEKALAEALAGITGTVDNEAIKTAIVAALAGYDATGLTEEQVQKIIEKALEGQLTDVQVEALIRDALKKISHPETDYDKIVSKILAKLPKTGITKDQLDAAIAAAFAELDDLAKPLTADQVKELIDAALEKINTYSEDDITRIVEAILASLTPSEPERPVGIAITAENYATVFDANKNQTDFYLEEDIVLSSTLSLKNKRNITIDLNGHTIASGTTDWNGTLINIKNSSIEFKNGSLINNNTTSNDTVYTITGSPSTLTADDIIFGGSCPDKIGLNSGTITLILRSVDLQGGYISTFNGTVVFECAGTFRVSCREWEWGSPTIQAGSGYRITATGNETACPDVVTESYREYTIEKD